MFSKIKILIAEDNQELSLNLRLFLDKQEKMSVIDCVSDGITALKKIESELPDVLLLDLVMQGLDGISILEELSKLNLVKTPVIIVISGLAQDSIIQRVLSLGADYYILKPFDYQMIANRIRALFEQKQSFSVYKNHYVNLKPKEILRNKEELNYAIEIETTNFIHEIGIPPHMKGYQYIREAIIQAINNREMVSYITKRLYPAVAEKYSTTPARVERAIRGGIEKAWSKNNEDLIDSLLGYGKKEAKDRPTNLEFIIMMVEKVKGSLKI